MPRSRREGRWIEKRGGIYYAYWYEPTAVRTHRKTLKTRDLAVAEERAKEMPEPAALGEQYRNWRNHVARMMACGRRNASRKKRTFKLSTRHVSELLAANGYCCAVTNIPLSYAKGPRNPWAPSLDRIDSLKGYEVGNVRVVCMVVNLAMSNWGEAVLRRMSNALAVR